MYVFNWAGSLLCINGSLDTYYNSLIRVIFTILMSINNFFFFNTDLVEGCSSKYIIELTCAQKRKQSNNSVFFLVVLGFLLTLFLVMSCVFINAERNCGLLAYLSQVWIVLVSTSLPFRLSLPFSLYPCLRNSCLTHRLFSGEFM